MAGISDDSANQAGTTDLKSIILLAVVLTGLIVVAAVCLFFPGAGDDRAADKTMSEPVFLDVGVNNSLKSAPLFIAREKGFFREQGLDVSLTVTESAAPLLEMMSEGTMNLVCAPEQLLAFRALERQDFRILAVLNRNQSQELILNTARGIDSISDLKGRRIGLKMSSAAPYFLYRKLLYHHVAMEEVELVDMKLEEMPEKMAAGEIEAAIAWPPHTDFIRQQLGEDVLTVNAHMGRDMYWLLVAEKKWVWDNCRTIDLLLAALDSTYAFMEASPEKAMKISSEVLGFPLDRVRLEWQTYHFELELPQSLLFAMEQEAAWRLRSKGEEVKPPDFSNLVECRSLEKLKPGQVTMIH